MIMEVVVIKLLIVSRGIDCVTGARSRPDCRERTMPTQLQRLFVLTFVISRSQVRYRQIHVSYESFTNVVQVLCCSHESSVNTAYRVNHIRTMVLSLMRPI